MSLLPPSLERELRETQGALLAEQTARRAVMAEKQELQDRVEELEEDWTTVAGEAKEMKAKVQTLSGHNANLAAQLHEANARIQQRPDRENFIQEVRERLQDRQQEYWWLALPLDGAATLSQQLRAGGELIGVARELKDALESRQAAIRMEGSRLEERLAALTQGSPTVVAGRQPGPSETVLGKRRAP